MKLHLSIVLTIVGVEVVFSGTVQLVPNISTSNI